MSGSSCTFCRASPWADPPDPALLDEVALITNLDVVRLTLRVLGATIWVGGQIALLALVEPLRRTAPAAVARSPPTVGGREAAIAPAARTFAWVAWPAFALLVVTGVWLIAAAGKQSDAYRTTLMLKMVFVVPSGVGAALHAFVKTLSSKTFRRPSHCSARCAPSCSASLSSRCLEPFAAWYAGFGSSLPQRGARTPVPRWGNDSVCQK